jgi:hypothetical protein
LVLILLGWKRLRELNWGKRPIGPLVARAIAVGFLAGAVMADAQPANRNLQFVDQERLVNLEPALSTGRHLIFVEYGPQALLHHEYVYNHADLEGSRMIWARYFGPESDLPVAHHFSGRQVWLLHVGGKLDLQPYLNGENGQAPSTQISPK